MSDDFSFTIEIPSDDDGFVLLQCSQCGEFFKLRPSDYESDDVLEIFCPSCGLTSEDYLTADAYELAIAIAKNKTMAMLFDGFKQLERSTRGHPVSFKAGKCPRPDNEPILQPSIDALAKATCGYCARESKLSRLLKMSVFVCPLCGVSNFNER